MKEKSLYKRDATFVPRVVFAFDDNLFNSRTLRRNCECRTESKPYQQD